MVLCLNLGLSEFFSVVPNWVRVASDCPPLQRGAEGLQVITNVEALGVIEESGEEAETHLIEAVTLPRLGILLMNCSKVLDYARAKWCISFQPSLRLTRYDRKGGQSTW